MLETIVSTDFCASHRDFAASTAEWVLSGHSPRACHHSVSGAACAADHRPITSRRMAPPNADANVIYWGRQTASLAEPAALLWKCRRKTSHQCPSSSSSAAKCTARCRSWCSCPASEALAPPLFSPPSTRACKCRDRQKVQSVGGHALCGFALSIHQDSILRHHHGDCRDRGHHTQDPPAPYGPGKALGTAGDGKDRAREDRCCNHQRYRGADASEQYALLLQCKARSSSFSWRSMWRTLSLRGIRP